jgi:putative tryptophan/tyrosine transport system substrate-binding protein
VTHPVACMRLVLVVLLVSGSVFSGNASAAKRDDPIQIGVLTASWGPTPQVVGLRDGLVKLGYREHEQFVMGVRFTQGDVTVLPAAARELVEYGVDVIIADGDASAKAAQKATSTIPIVFASVSHPVKLGLVQSFARPGGNITGVTELELDLSGKRANLADIPVETNSKIEFVINLKTAKALGLTFAPEVLFQANKVVR